MEFTEDKAIFLQIADMIENDIVRGIFLEDERSPSTNELAALYGINPNTVAKSLTVLTNDGILYKKRGVGMFVAPGAREKILAKRREKFAAEYIAPMVREAKLLGLDTTALSRMIEEAYKEDTDE